MYKNLFLTTVDDGSHYKQTVVSPADLSDWADRPTDIPSSARVWGIRDAGQNRAVFNRMTSEDYVLFYKNGTEMYVGAGIVGTKCNTPWLKETFWDGSDRTLVFTIPEYHATQAPLKKVNSALGYKPIYHPQAIVRVSDDRQLEDAISMFGFDE